MISESAGNSPFSALSFTSAPHPLPPSHTYVIMEELENWNLDVNKLQ